MPRYVYFLGLILPLAWQSGQAQSTATLTGRVLDPDEAVVAKASVSLLRPLSGFVRQTETDGEGLFRFSNVPFQGYSLCVERFGFQTDLRRVELRSSVPVHEQVALQLETRVDDVSVNSVGQLTLLDPEASGTKMQLNHRIIDKLPVASSARGLESVLLSFPGFAANANGTIHPRGAHNQMTYVIDGMPISDQFSGQFATSIDPNLVQTLELFTGDIPAEYGAKLSAVANITTRSGFDGGGGRFGRLELGGGGFNTLNQSVQTGGAQGNLGWFAAVSSIKSSRFLDSPSFENLHNGGNAQRSFARVDLNGSVRNLFRFSILGGRSSFQLANLRSQHANGQQQRRLLSDVAFSMGYVRILSPAATFESTTGFRATTATLFPSPGDIPVTSEMSRRLATLSSFNRFNMQHGKHELRIGLDAQHFPLSETFGFALTDPLFNNDSGPEFNPNLIPFDLSRNGAWFRFRASEAGQLFTLFLQDRVRWRNFVFNLGARFDRYNLLVRESELQPRIGLAYHLSATGTVLRASYNRNLQTPPNENLLLANSALSASLAPPDVRRILNGGVIPIPSQKQNVYEIGLQQNLANYFSVNAAFYHKNSNNLQDNDNFLNTGIIFPTSLATSRVNGFEARIAMPEARRISGSLSLTHYHSVVSPPFTGGLFLGSYVLEALSAGPFVIDHDQELGISGNLIYRPAKRWWTSFQMRHDSGLVSNPSDPVQVAADPDYYDQLPYVDLYNDPPRVRPRTIVDASLGYEKYAGDRRQWELVLQVSNLTNRKALYSFQSVFVGTRVVQPRSLNLRLRFFW